MAVLLANADPEFPFVDCARRYAADLFPTAGVRKTRLINFAQPKPGSDNWSSDPSEIDRQIWGYWPTERGGDAVLIKDDLLDFAKSAKPIGEETPDLSVVFILITRDQLKALAETTGQTITSGVTRQHLEELRASIMGETIAATKRQSSAVTHNLYVRRVLAVQSSLGETPDTIDCAFKLVDAGLVDTVVFLAASEPTHQRARDAYFVALRLLEVAAGHPDVEAWFNTHLVGTRQDPNSVCRFEFDRSILSLPTASRRRLEMVRDALDNLKRVTLERQRAGATVDPGSVKMTDDKISDLFKEIEDAEEHALTVNRLPGLSSRGDAQLYAGSMYNSQRVDEIARRAERDVKQLVTQLHADIELISPETIRLEPGQSGQTPTLGGETDIVAIDALSARKQLEDRFQFDEKLSLRLRDLASGGFRDGQAGKSNLQKLVSDLNARIERTINEQGALRAKVDNALPANFRRDVPRSLIKSRLDELSVEMDAAVAERRPVQTAISAAAHATYTIEPEDPVSPPIEADPIVLPLEGARRGSHYRPEIRADRALLEHARRSAMDSARGLFRPLSVVFILGAVIAVVVPLYSANVLTWDVLIAAVTLQSAEAFIITFLCFVFPAIGVIFGLIGSKRELSRAGRRFDERSLALVQAARDPLADAQRYRTKRIAGGRRLLLRRRLAELDRALNRLEAVKAALDRIAPPQAEEPASSKRAKIPEDYSAFRAAIEERLAGMQRERWAIEALRHPDDPPKPVLIKYSSEKATANVPQTVFLIPAPEIKFEALLSDTANLEINK